MLSQGFEFCKRYRRRKDMPVSMTAVSKGYTPNMQVTYYQQMAPPISHQQLQQTDNRYKENFYTNQTQRHPPGARSFHLNTMQQVNSMDQAAIFSQYPSCPLKEGPQNFGAPPLHHLLWHASNNGPQVAMYPRYKPIVHIPQYVNICIWVPHLITQVNLNSQPSQDAMEKYLPHTDDPRVASMQKKSILLQESYIKKVLKMRKVSIFSILNSLKNDGCITQLKLEEIYDKSLSQEEAFDMLFTVVLENLKNVSAFMRILKSDSDLSYTAIRINRTQLSAKEMKDFPDTCKLMIVQIVKQIEYLKEELVKSLIKEVANILYSLGLLGQDELEQIQYLTSNKPRRKSIDFLLKTVMLGNPPILPAFMHILQTKSHLSIINTTVCPREMYKFLQLEEISQGKRQSVEIDDSQRFHISDSEIEFVIYYILKFPEIVDKITDRLLSKFFISIRNHTKILRLVGEKKIYKLFDLMKNCSHEVYDEFGDVLTKNGLKHVLCGLESNRILKNKRTIPSMSPDDSPQQKRRRTCCNKQETWPT